MDVDLIGRVVVGLGGTYGCRCGIFYAHILEVLFYVVLVSLTSSYPSSCSPYSSELIGRGCFWSASRVLLCVRVRRHGTFLLWKWLSSVLLLFLVLLGFLFLVCVCVCACSLLSVVLCTRIGVLVPGFTIFLVDYSLDQ